jgi:hypothetical protein
VPGSSGTTCSLLAASSRISSSCRPASRSRHSAIRASSPGGTCPAGTPAVSSKLASASAGATGCWPGVCPCSGTKICPPGNRPASRCAACTANAVLPIPAIPPIAWIPTTPPSAAWSSIAPSSRVSSAPRPVKPATSRGSVRVAAAANAPTATPCRAASTSAAGALPRAAATNSARTGPARPSAPASNWAVSLCAVRLTPRSRSLTDRGRTPDASASSSWVSLASARSCRNNAANESPGCSSTAQTSRPPARGHQRRLDRCPKPYADPAAPASRARAPHRR